MSELPSGWIGVRLGELGNWFGGGTPSKSNASFWAGDLPWVSPKDMKRAFIDDTQDKITLAAVQSSATSLIPARSVLIVTRSGILRHSLPVAVNTREVAINQDLKALVVAPFAEPEFVAWQLQSCAQSILASCAKSGTTVDSVDFDLLRAFTLSLPPLAEQRRIVAKLDALTARTARARTDLDRIPALAARYKQSILSAAFASYERGPRLSLGSLISEAQNGLSKRRADAGAPINVLRLADLSDGVFVGAEPRAIALNAKEAAKYALESGDLVCIRVNGSERLVGRLIKWGTEQGWAYCDHFIRFRVKTDEVDPQYLSLFFDSDEVRAQIEVAFVSSAGQKTVSQGTLNRIMVPLPPLEEQAAAVLRIEAAFTEIDRLTTEAAAARRLLDRLDQAVLAKAFRGELVPQDPTDEPANVLLDRIRAERAAEPKAKRGRKPVAA